MKKILIIYPQWIPCNLVGVQRSRLISNYLNEFGWEPIILTVNHKYYKNSLVPELSKLVRSKIEVHYVEAIPPRKFPFIGDMALRAFHNLKNKAIELIQQKQIDFLWLPIPSYYNALLGRPIHKATGIPYGIDYIDPWVNGFPGQNKFLSKAWIANQLSKILEPYAVKKASLISGVAYHYYSPVLERNFKNKKVEHCAMQYGFDPDDYTLKPNPYPLPWNNTDNIKPIIYAGAFLPKSHLFLKLLFKSIAQLRKEKLFDSEVQLFFIGTGPYQGKSIMDYALEYNINDIVHEQRERRSYLQILDLLKKAYGVMVLGSTEKHYTASKLFQSLLSGTPVFSVFHYQSEAAALLKELKADGYSIFYHEDEPEIKLFTKIKDNFQCFISHSNKWEPQLNKLERYSAKQSAKKLIQAIEKVL